VKTCTTNGDCKCSEQCGTAGYCEPEEPEEPDTIELSAAGVKASLNLLCAETADNKMCISRMLEIGDDPAVLCSIAASVPCCFIDTLDHATHCTRDSETADGVNTAVALCGAAIPPSTPLCPNYVSTVNTKCGACRCASCRNVARVATCASRVACVAVCSRAVNDAACW
jgi:hypothetical protein